MKRWLTIPFAVVVLGLVLWTATAIYAALTVTASSDTDWTAVAAAGTAQSGAIDISGSYATGIQIQAFLDSATAHEGTEFIIQTSFNTTGNEDWSDLARFTDLVGTANSEAITNNPLAAASTTITCASTTGYTVDATSMRWVAIENATLANSELILQTGFTTDTNITCLDGTTNEHAQNTLMWNIASSRTIAIPFGSGVRARVVVNNNYDADGTASSLNFRVRKVLVTAIQ